jgi:hypothetical protein
MQKAKGAGVLPRVIVPFILVFLVVTAVTLLWNRQGARMPEAPMQVMDTRALPVPMHIAPPAGLSETGHLPKISTWVLYAGQAIPSDGGNLALPSGAKFAVRVTSTAEGRLSFYTINPQGVLGVKPLWEIDIKAGESLVSPDLSLRGAQGLETLRVLLRPTSGGDTVEQHVQLTHGK